MALQPLPQMQASNQPLLGTQQQHQPQRQQDRQEYEAAPHGTEQQGVAGLMRLTGDEDEDASTVAGGFAAAGRPAAAARMLESQWLDDGRGKDAICPLPPVSAPASCPHSTAAAQAPGIKPEVDCAGGAASEPPAAGGMQLAAHHPGGSEDRLMMPRQWEAGSQQAAETTRQRRKSAKAGGPGDKGGVQQLSFRKGSGEEAPCNAATRAHQLAPASSGTLLADIAALSGSQPAADKDGRHPSFDGATIEVTYLVTASGGSGTSLAGPLSPLAAASTAETQHLSVAGAASEVAALVGCEQASTQVVQAVSALAPRHTESAAGVSGADHLPTAGRNLVERLAVATAPLTEAEQADEAESPELPLHPQPCVRRISKRMRAEMEAEVLQGWFDPEAVARRARVRDRLNAGCSAADALAAWRGEADTPPLSERLRRVVAAASAYIAANSAGRGAEAGATVPRR
jgi:hypothetical protein